MSLLDSLKNILAPAANARSTRRSFFKQAGATTIAAVAAPSILVKETYGAPLYIPSNRLEFGVPTGKLLLPPSIQRQADEIFWDYDDPNPAPVQATAEWVEEQITQVQRDPLQAGPPRVGQVQMLLTLDTYTMGLGSLKIGDTVNVDQRTALRWQEWSIAVPAPSSYTSPTEVARLLRQREIYESNPHRYRPYQSGQEEPYQDSSRRPARQNVDAPSMTYNTIEV